MPSHCDRVITVYIQFRSMSYWPCWVSGSAGVFPNVRIVNVGNDQHAGPRAHHGGRDTGPRVEVLAFEAPGDGDRHVSLWDDTSQLCKFTGVNNISAKGEWNNAGRF